MSRAITRWPPDAGGARCPEPRFGDVPAATTAEPPAADLPALDPQPLGELVDMIGAGRTDAILAVFAADVGTRVATARTAFDSGNLAVVGREFHALKSSARSVGAMRLGAAAATLEDAVRLGDPGMVRIVMADLGPIVDATLAAIARYRAASDAAPDAPGAGAAGSAPD